MWIKSQPTIQFFACLKFGNQCFRQAIKKIQAKMIVFGCTQIKCSQLDVTHERIYPEEECVEGTKADQCIDIGIDLEWGVGWDGGWVGRGGMGGMGGRI